MSEIAERPEKPSTAVLIPIACMFLALAVRLIVPIDGEAAGPWMRGAEALFGVSGQAPTGPERTDLIVALPLGLAQHTAWLAAKVAGTESSGDRSAWIRGHAGVARGALAFLWIVAAAASAGLAAWIAIRERGALAGAAAGILVAVTSVGIAGTQRLEAWAIAAPLVAGSFATGSILARGVLLGVAVSFTPLAFVPAIAAGVAGGSRIRRALLIAAPLWLALDWRRLAHISSVGDEFGRAFIGAGILSSGAGEAGKLLIAPWGPGPGVLVLALLGAWSLRRAGLGWAALAGIASLWILPACLGSRRPDGPGFLLPLLAVAAAVGAAGAVTRARPPVRRVLTVCLALAMLAPPLAGAAGHLVASAGRRSRGGQLAEVLEREVGNGGLLLRDPAVPVAPDGVASFPLPRHVGNPEAWDFAYWPGWYGSFTHVVFRMRTLEDLGADARRTGAQTMLRALLRHADAIAQVGNPSLDASTWVLFRLRPGRPWSLDPGGGTDSLSGGPREAAYLGDLAGFLGEHGRRDPALSLLRLALRWDRTNPKLWNNLGSTLLLMGEPEQAAEALEEGLRHEPDVLELRYNLGKAYLDGGVYGRAIAELRRAVTLRPSFAPAHYDLARAAIQEGNWPVAAEALRTYLRMAPDAPNRSQVEAALRDAEQRMSAGGPRP